MFGELVFFFFFFKASPFMFTQGSGCATAFYQQKGGSAGVEKGRAGATGKTLYNVMLYKGNSSKLNNITN